MEYGFDGYNTQDYTPRQTQILDNIFQIAREKFDEGIKLHEIKLFCKSSAASFYLPRAMYEQKLHTFLVDLEGNDSQNRLFK